MKKSKIYLFVLSALLPLLWLACSKENPTTPDPIVDPIVKKGKFPVTFSLTKGPTATPKTYASITALEAERKVSEMVAMVFSKSDNKFIAPLPVTVSNQAGENQAATDTILKGKFDVGDYGSDGKQIKFVLVANVSAVQIQAAMEDLVGKVTSANVATDLTLNDIKALEIKKAPEPQQHFVMLSTQESEVTLQKNTIQNVTTPITMRRLSARIDAKIGGGLQNNGLTIQKITVKNSQQKSFLYEKAGGTDHLDTGKTDKDYIISTPETSYAVYTYENSQVADTYLEVTVALNGNTLDVVEVPFTGITIERHHLYKVTLNRTTQNPPRIIPKIDVEDWKYAETHTDTSIPAISNVTQKQSDWTTDVSSVTMTTQNDHTEIKADNMANYLVLDVTGSNAHSSAAVTSTGTSWITVTHNTATNPYNDEFRVEIEANTTYVPRTATIEITKDNDTSKKVEVTIRQRPTLALEKVAEYNLAPDGKSFMTTHEYSSGQQGYFNWSEADKHSKAMSGYHLPTIWELKSIFPGSGHNPIGFQSARNTLDVPDPANIDGTTKDYSADYKTDGNGKAYAIKMKGEGDVQRTAYRYRLEGTSGGNNFRMIVEAVYLGPTSSETITSISNDSFWTTHAPEKVTREFWASGYNHGFKKSGLEGFFWSATPLMDDAFALRFAETYVHTRSNGVKSQSASFTVRLFKDH